MEIIWSDLSRSDLLGIITYLTEEDHRLADRALQKIKKAVASLETFPNRGRPGRLVHTKELLVQDLPYMLVYRIRNNNLEILRILHFSQLSEKESTSDVMAAFQ